MHLTYKQMLPRSSQANLLLHASHDRRVRRNRKLLNLQHPTSPLGPTKISITATTNVLFVLRISRGTREEFGPAELAGPCSILVVSRSGRRTRVRPQHANRLRMVSCRLQGNGAVLGVIFLKMFCPKTSIAGVRRSSTPRLYQDCRPFHADRLGEWITLMISRPFAYSNSCYAFDPTCWILPKVPLLT